MDKSGKPLFKIDNINVHGQHARGVVVEDRSSEPQTMDKSGKPLIAVDAINVYGEKARGVVVEDTSSEPQTKSASSQRGKTSKPTKLSFGYTEYADRKNTDMHRFDDCGIEDDKKTSAEKYTVSGKGIKNRGYALIINVSSNGNDERKGSENDVRKMDSLWKNLGFEVELKRSLTDTAKDQIETALQKAAGRYGGIGVIVIIIMSHGKIENGEEVFATSDRKCLKYNDVISLFDNQNAKSLRGIPKLFFFQYCRGNFKDFLEEDQVIEIEELSKPDSEEDLEEDEETDLPLRSDMMIAHASMLGYSAMRDMVEGSFFFNTIADVFEDHAKDEHVLELMTRVNAAMAAKTYNWEGKKRKQMNEVKFNLTKRLYLLK